MGDGDDRMFHQRALAGTLDVASLTLSVCVREWTLRVSTTNCLYHARPLFLPAARTSGPATYSIYTSYVERALRKYEPHVTPTRQRHLLVIKVKRLTIHACVV